MEQKVALVTGGSRGIGKAIARGLVEEGYFTVLVGRDAATLEVAAKELGQAGFIVADLVRPEAPDEVIKTCAARYGRLDVLVNCAGLSAAGSFTEVTPDEWDRIFAVNARAPFFLCRAALPLLKAAPKAFVINIASVVGFKGYINQSVYASSKHALTGFTKVFAKEVQPFGIRVHLISPGGVATEMVRQMRPDIQADELIQPEEIADIVRFIVTRPGNGTIDHFYIRRYSGLAFD